MKLKNFYFIFIFIFIFLYCSNSFAAETPILVNQPAYNSMNFYVYRPENLSSEWYVTYDGYLVYKNSKGVWHYGSNGRNGITKTDFVVGSVIPSVIGLVPFDKKASTVAPILRDLASSTNETITSLNQTQPQAFSPTPEMLVQSPAQTNIKTDWAQNPDFMAVGRWGMTVDRMGVLNKPSIPVAWRGEYPEVIYAWTGMYWRQIPARASSNPLSIIRNELYSLTVDAGRSRVKWRDEDNPVLSQYAALWGYQWLGKIFVNNSR